MKKGDTNY